MPLNSHPKPTSITVSAPGSIMICGEHSVVYGHRAIVCAIEQRIQVTLRPRDDRLIYINSELATYQATIDKLLSHPKLTFVIKAIAEANLAFGIELDIVSAINPMLGLGSSAAVTAATLGALSLLTQSSFDLAAIHQQALTIVHAIQQRGSGADLAASIYGGLIAYQNQPIIIDPITTSLPCCLALHYSGYKTPTAEVLAMIADKMHSAPDDYQRLYQQMGKVTEQAITAIKVNDMPEFYKYLNQYQNLLTMLGVCDDKLATMICEARSQQQTLASKISGSGLGDCIVTLYQADKPTPTNHTPISIARQGLKLEQSSS